VLRSKSPELVEQEIWGHLCCHYAIRTLMADAAQHSGHDPDRMSFVAALRTARQSIAPGALPPRRHHRQRPALAARHPPTRPPALRLRAAPRVINREMPRWHIKRRHHLDWPHPQHPLAPPLQ